MKKVLPLFEDDVERRTEWKDLIELWIRIERKLGFNASVNGAVRPTVGLPIKDTQRISRSSVQCFDRRKSTSGSRTIENRLRSQK